MNFYLEIFTVVLFVLLTPGILLRLPPKGGNFTVALVHGLVFAIVFYFIKKYFSNYLEGAQVMGKKGELMKPMNA
jgi:hypothetical protein